MPVRNSIDETHTNAASERRANVYTTSVQYAADLNEVKELGALNSATHTADQTHVARLWANINTPTNFLLVWNNVARTMSVDREISTVQKARLFAVICGSFKASPQVISFSPERVKHFCPAVIINHYHHFAMP